MVNVQALRTKLAATSHGRRLLHVNQQVPDTFFNESFSHIHTWHTKYPISGQKYALEFDIK